MDLKTEWMSLCARHGYAKAVNRMNRLCASDPARRAAWQSLQCESKAKVEGHDHAKIDANPEATHAAERYGHLYENTAEAI